MKHVSTPHAPLAIGPYSQAIVSSNYLFCSGQIALDPKTGELVNSTIKDETKTVLNNLQAIIKAAGLSMSDVVRVEIYLRDLKNYETVNKVYEEFFKGPVYPARLTVEVSRLPRDANVEISCIAEKAQGL